MDKIAVDGLRYVAGGAGKVVGGVELIARNVMPMVIGMGVGFGKVAKGYLPDFMVGLGRAVRDSPAAEFAKSAAGQKLIEEAANGISGATESTIFFGCIIVYIMAALFLVLLVIIVGKLRKMNKIGIYVGIPGFNIAASTEKGGRRRTKRKRHIIKRTRKRYHK
jgi:hypothetical protein